MHLGIIAGVVSRFRVGFCLVLAVGLFSSGCGQEQAEVEVEVSSIADPSSLYGWWDLVEVNGDDAGPGRGDSNPSLFVGIAPPLNEQDQRPGHFQFGGFDGCNGFGGTYSLEGGRFESLGIARTLVGCGSDLGRQVQIVDGVLAGATVEVADWRLTLVGDDGNVAKYRRSDVGDGEGVYRLESVDGELVDSDVSLVLWVESFSGFAKCFVNGQISRAGEMLSFGAPVSMNSQTTTVPDGYKGGSLPKTEPVDALFGCEGPSDPEAAMLKALDGGQGIAVDDLVTITSSSGQVLVLRHA